MHLTSIRVAALVDEQWVSDEIERLREATVVNLEEWTGRLAEEIGDRFPEKITAFHPGAMQESRLNKVGDTEGITLGIVAPDAREAMLQHGRDFKAHGIPFIFDPGQAMTLFSGDDLKEFIELANWLIVNDYEFQLLSGRTGLDKAGVAAPPEPALPR